MSDLVLHHYDLSPFSEKVRVCLGRKGLAWKAVEQPVVAPKPKLTALTGGYRKIPVLQIGADVYCDTACILDEIERRHPEPPILDGSAEIVAHWADHWLFMAAVPPAISKLLPMLPPDFLEDRAAMSPGFSKENLEAALPDARSRIASATDTLSRRLGAHEWLVGDGFTVADAAVFHILWFLRSDPDAFEAALRPPGLRAWFERVEAIGHGERSDLDADDALAIARDAKPATKEESDGTDPKGVEPGTEITVRADDYGADPITGTAVVVTSRRIALRRSDPDVGEVVVHFPRAGFTYS